MVAFGKFPRLEFFSGIGLCPARKGPHNCLSPDKSFQKLHKGMFSTSSHPNEMMVSLRQMILQFITNCQAIDANCIPIFPFILLHSSCINDQREKEVARCGICRRRYKDGYALLTQYIRQKSTISSANSFSINALHI